MSNMKTCNLCHQAKEDSEFYPKRRQCKECLTVCSKKYYGKLKSQSTTIETSEVGVQTEEFKDESMKKQLADLSEWFGQLALKSEERDKQMIAQMKQINERLDCITSAVPSSPMSVSTSHPLKTRLKSRPSSSK
jgi:hypothetical protein